MTKISAEANNQGSRKTSSLVSFPPDNHTRCDIRDDVVDTHFWVFCRDFLVSRRLHENVNYHYLENFRKREVQVYSKKRAENKYLNWPETRCLFLSGIAISSPILI